MMKTVQRWLLIALIILPLVAVTQTKGPYEEREKQNLLNEKGLKVGFWKEKKGELTSMGSYVNGIKDGTWETYLSNHQIFRIETYDKGKRNGITLQFNRKGKISNLEHYKNNKMDGLVYIYSPRTSNLLKEQRFSNGMLTGLFRNYYDNGKIQEEAFYQDNQKHGPSKWFNRDGRLIAIYNYHHGLFEGTQRTFYDNDTTATITFYVNNEPEGDYKEYYRNGKLKLTGKYVNGKKEGKWTEYDETGKESNVTRYKNGIAK